MASLTTTSPAHAFAVPPEVGAPLPQVDVHYAIHQNFYDAFYGGAHNKDAPHTADQAWRGGAGAGFEGSIGNYRIWDTGFWNHVIQAVAIDGTALKPLSRVLLVAMTPYIAFIWVEPYGYDWNTIPQNNTAPGWVDLTGLLVHEMGHWAGLKHSCDHPGSDGGVRPSMFDPDPCGGSVLGANSQHQRTIQADDVNALNVARPGSSQPGFRNILANHNFDFQGLGYSRTANSGVGPIPFTDPGWGGAYDTGWGKVGSSQVGRNCNPEHGQLTHPCFMTVVNGPGAQSLYQDVAIWDGNYIRGYGLTPGVYVRSPWISGSAQLVVWNLDTGGAVYVQNCTLPPGQWIPCGYNFSFPEPPGTWLRFEIYNTSNTYLDIDAASLAF
ncbi:MAG TPA: hypothetical protein VG795_11905 [Acidimicrobiia bacterium]|nr:hypothetical protein [Acidimicrobiia bacterium]